MQLITLALHVLKSFVEHFYRFLNKLYYSVFLQAIISNIKVYMTDFFLFA